MYTEVVGWMKVENYLQAKVCCQNPTCIGSLSWYKLPETLKLKKKCWHTLEITFFSKCRAYAKWYIFCNFEEYCQYFLLFLHQLLWSICPKLSWLLWFNIPCQFSVRNAKYKNVQKSSPYPQIAGHLNLKVELFPV